MNNSKIWYPFIFACVLALGIFVGLKINQPMSSQRSLFSFRTGQFNKINDVMNYINQEYVDTINQKTLVENTIEDLLHNLDPHSAYIPAEDLQAVNEPLEGNFDGIGIEFHIQDDTIMVVSALSGGPSEQLGILSGDRIVKIEGKNVTGKDVNNQLVMQQLRGPSGSLVRVGIFRRGMPKLIDFTIKRGKIPIYSIDVSYMLDSKTGYIKVSHFAERTYDEYVDAFMKLKEQGMQNLVMDLRGNPGGYLKTAIQLADEFLGDKKLIVYTQGRSRPRENYYATSRGFFEQGKLVLLMDEGSASASEILAGAVQDWDRATIVGRRSFGKGLVQEQSAFPDGSAIRLTIARYYTPTGRSIQKPYTGGYLEYENELQTRYQNGELSNTDSIHFADSLKYKTPGGHIVYGGGGIMPDVFVPLDTSGNSLFYAQASGNGDITQFAYNYVDKNRQTLARYKTFAEFKSSFVVDNDMYSRFVDFVVKNGLKRDENGIRISSDIIRLQLKALIARQLWKNAGFYPVIQEQDKTLAKALQLMEENKVASK
jgi:carboxyl-terminal processing protease